MLERLPLLSRLCLQAKCNPKTLNRLLECYIVTFYLGRGRITWKLPNENRTLANFLSNVQALALYGIKFGTDNLAQLLKNLSNLCRKCWLEGGDLPKDPIYHSVIDLAVWGYMGRSLPVKPQHLVEKDRKETMQRFMEEPTIKKDSAVMNVARQLLNKWTRLRPELFQIETPPYSESASLITTRMQGGQASFFRDIYNLMEVITRGEKRKVFYGHSLPAGELTHDDHMCSFTYYPGGIKPNDRGHITQTISEFLYFLDLPFLNHVRDCNGSCNQPELHFPFSIQGIPETGWRSRCASMPWPSLVFMTEIPRRVIMRGTKKDVYAGSALRDFKDLPSVCAKQFINSTDMASATDHLPLEVQYLMGRNIGKNWKGSLYEKYVYASFSSQRLVDAPFLQWPGIEYFLPKEKPRIVLDYVKEHNQNHGERSKWLRFFAQFGFESQLPLTPSLSIREASSTDQHTIERVCFVPAGTPSSKEKCFDTCANITRGEERTKSLYELDHEEVLVLLSQIRDWYRKCFTSVKGSLTRKGQHMSLPLSWVVLSALNNACAILGKIEDPEAIIFTMGDDCVFATDNMNSVNRYKKHLVGTGFKINHSKDATSHIGRAVFCEHLVDEGRWVDKPRPKVVTHPAVDRKGIAWLSVRDSPPKWLAQQTKVAIQELKIAKYSREIKQATLYGFDPELPPQFGGLGIRWQSRHHSYYLRKLSNVAFDAKTVITLDKDIQRLIGLNPAYSSSPYLWSQLHDLDIFFKSGGSDGYKNEEVSDLLVSSLLPSLIYQPGFERESFSIQSPKVIGERIFEFYSKMPGSTPGTFALSDLLHMRQFVRYKSGYLDYLKKMQLDNLYFWRTPVK